MSTVYNAIASLSGTGNQVAAVDGLMIAKGSTAQRLLGVTGVIRFNASTNVFEATADGATYVTFASAAGPILSITGTANRITVSAGVNPIVDIAATYVGQTSITTLGTITTGTWAGTAITEIHGGTNQTTYILGDTLYASAANTLAKLAGNITAVKQYLSQTGTGAVSAAPAWATISGGDITGAALSKTDDTNVTMILGGTPLTALLRAASMTLGWTGVLSLARGGTNADTSAQASNGGIVWSNATQMQILAGTATASKMLLSGASATPSWSTSTIPSSAGATVGKVLASDGTNYVLSTATFPVASATAGKFIQSDGTNWVASTPTLPTAASTAGKILQSDGTNFVQSTPTYPSTSGTAGKILRSDGTNNVYTTSTFADTYTASNLLYSNGANTVTGLATANNGTLVTSNAGVPSILAGPGTTGNMFQSQAAAAPAWSTATWPSTTTINRLLYSSANNTVTDLATANSSVLITSAGGVPSLSTTLPSGIAATNMNLTTPTLGVASATSINFGGTALSVYAEGTWTPTDQSGAALGLTASGVYTRIGNMVHASSSITYPATVDGSTVVLGGLPFTSNGNAQNRGGCIIGFSSVTTLSRAVVNVGATTFNLYTSAGVGLINSAMSGSTSFITVVYFL